MPPSRSSAAESACLSSTLSSTKRRSAGHVSAISWEDVELFACQLDAAGPLDDEPVFFSWRMGLVAELLRRNNCGAFGLVVGCLVEHRVVAPGSFIMVRGHRLNSCGDEGHASSGISGHA